MKNEKSKTIWGNRGRLNIPVLNEGSKGSAGIFGLFGPGYGCIYDILKVPTVF